MPAPPRTGNGRPAEAEIRALTVKQPWACAIATGAKDVENRRWYTRYRGLLAIHAGRDFDRQPTVEWAGASLAYIRAPYSLNAMSALLATAHLTDCHPWQPGCCESPWAEHGPGIWHWVLGDALALPDPITGVSGALGLWRPAEQVGDALRRHAAAGPRPSGIAGR